MRDNLGEKKNFFCSCTPECQIRLQGCFELDMTASQNGSQFTYPNENPPFKSNESNEASHKSTNPTAHTILKSSPFPSPLSLLAPAPALLPPRSLPHSSSISSDNSIISGRVTRPDPPYLLNLLEAESQ